MKYLWQIVRKLQEKDELNEEEMRDLIDYLNVLKEELKKLRIILYSPFGYIADFDVVFKDPWYCSEVHLRLLNGEHGLLYLDSFIWRIFSNEIEVKPFINEVVNS
jgi:hypothetical protein